MIHSIRPVLRNGLVVGLLATMGCAPYLYRVKVKAPLPADSPIAIAVGGDADDNLERFLEAELLHAGFNVVASSPLELIAPDADEQASAAKHYAALEVFLAGLNKGGQIEGDAADLKALLDIVETREERSRLRSLYGLAADWAEHSGAAFLLSAVQHGGTSYSARVIHLPSKSVIASYAVNADSDGWQENFPRINPAYGTSVNGMQKMAVRSAYGVPALEFARDLAQQLRSAGGAGGGR